jgi:hypothetical protein
MQYNPGNFRARMTRGARSDQVLGRPEFRAWRYVAGFSACFTTSRYDASAGTWQLGIKPVIAVID